MTDTPANLVLSEITLTKRDFDKHPMAYIQLTEQGCKTVCKALRMLDAVESRKFERAYDGQKLLSECMDEEYGYNNGFNACLKTLREIADDNR